MAGREPPATVHEWVQWEIFYKSGALFISILVYNHLGTCYHIVSIYYIIYIYSVYIYIYMYIHTVCIYMYIYTVCIYIYMCVLVYWRLAKTRGGKLLLNMASMFRPEKFVEPTGPSSCFEHMMLRWKAWNHPKRSSLLIIAFYQWPFQEPKLEVPIIYKACVRPM